MKQSFILLTASLLSSVPLMQAGAAAAGSVSAEQRARADQAASQSRVTLVISYCLLPSTGTAHLEQITDRIFTVLTQDPRPDLVLQKVSDELIKRLRQAKEEIVGARPAKRARTVPKARRDDPRARLREGLRRAEYANVCLQILQLEAELSALASNVDQVEADRAALNMLD